MHRQSQNERSIDLRKDAEDFSESLQIDSDEEKKKKKKKKSSEALAMASPDNLQSSGYSVSLGFRPIAIAI